MRDSSRERRRSKHRKETGLAFDPRLNVLPDGRCARITQRKPWLVAMLGLPTLLVGMYIGFYTLYAPAHYIWHGASLGEWLRALPALAIMIVLTALFLLPSALFMFSAGIDVCIDRAAGTVTSREGLLSWGRRQVIPLSGIDRISIETEKRSGRTVLDEATPATARTTQLEHVKLTEVGGGREVLLGTFLAVERDETRAFARALAEFMGLSFRQ